MNTESKFNFRNQVISLVILIALFAGTFLVIHNHVMAIDGQLLLSVLGTLKTQYIWLSILAILLYIYLEGRCMALVSAAIGHKIGRVKSTVYSSVDLYFSAITPAAIGGQPAVAYYMSKDGIDISQSSTVLLFNTIEYIGSLVFMGLAVMVAYPSLVFSENGVVTVLFVVGMAANILLIAACLLCMLFQQPVRHIGLFVIRFLCKIKMVHSQSDKIESLDRHLQDYKACVRLIKESRRMSIEAFICNILQRISGFSVAYFVYLSFGLHECSFFYILAIQIVTAIAVNSLPLPGGVGASEGVFLALYSPIYTGNMLLPALFLTRGISYFFILILCGIVSIQQYFRILKQTRGKKSHAGIL